MKNKFGGVDPDTPEAAARAKAVDLITMPIDIKGTNCGNCMFFSKQGSSGALCQHPEVRQPVNERMCCNRWNAKGTHRPWEKI